MTKVLIHSHNSEELQIAILDDTRGELERFQVEPMNSQQVTQENIYLGTITSVAQSLEACFIDYGYGRDGFLPMSQIYESYGELSVGKKIIVQIVQEGQRNKGASLTTYISLSGHYLVLKLNISPMNHAISRRLSALDKRRIAELLEDISITNGQIIVRTSAGGKPNQSILNELKKLQDEWKKILRKASKISSPTLLRGQKSVIQKIAREYFSEAISEVYVDNAAIYKSVKEELNILAPEYIYKISYHQHPPKIFEAFGVTTQIRSLFQREVRLSSGGSIILEQTEALMSIDVNSKHSLKQSNLEETAFSTNLEAAREIMKQIRCRNVGGLIIIDFIDMALPSHRKEIESEVLTLARRDRSKIHITRISKIGIMEMSRQRMVKGTSLQKARAKQDPIELALDSVEKYSRQVKSRSLFLFLPAQTIMNMQDNQMHNLSQLQSKLGLNLVIIHSSRLKEGEFHISDKPQKKLFTHERVFNFWNRINLMLRPLFRKARNYISELLNPKLADTSYSLKQYNRSIRFYPAPPVIEESISPQKQDDANQALAEDIEWEECTTLEKNLN